MTTPGQRAAQNMLACKLPVPTTQLSSCYIRCSPYLVKLPVVMLGPHHQRQRPTGRHTRQGRPVLFVGDGQQATSERGPFKVRVSTIRPGAHDPTIPAYFCLSSTCAAKEPSTKVSNSERALRGEAEAPGKGSGGRSHRACRQRCFHRPLFWLRSPGGSLGPDQKPRKRALHAHRFAYPSSR